MDFILQQFWAFTKQHPWLTSSNILLSMTFPIDDVLIPYLSGKIVSNVQEKKPWLKALVGLIVVLVLMQIVYTLTYWHDAKLFPKLQNHIRDSMLSDIVQHFQQSEADVQTGELMSRLVKIPMCTVTVFEDFKNYLGTYVISFFVTAMYITYNNWVVGLTLTLAGIIVIFLILRSPKSCEATAMSQETSLEELDEATEDVLRNLPTVYTNDQVQRELTGISGMGKRFETAFINTTNCTVVQKMWTVLTLSSMLVFFGWYSYRSIESKKMKIGFFVSVFIIIIQWYSSLGWLSSHIRELVMEWGVLTAHTRLFKDLPNSSTPAKAPAAPLAPALAPAAPLAPAPTITPPPAKGLYVENVSYDIKGRATPILDDITLYVATGQTVGIVGNVGSGKTTLLKIIARLIKPTSGEVYIDGRALSSMTLPESRKLVGYVQQQTQLFNRTIYENIVYGLPGNEGNPRATKENVVNMVESLGLTDAFSNLLNGLDTLAGKNGSVLSGGQRQLVQMMRLIVTDPQIVVLDEITASLDSATKQKLFKLLDVALKGKTTLLVTHDPELMTRAQRILKFEDGKLVGTSQPTGA